ncbi:MAG TPA: PAS domain S-box protein [Nitrospira sp.]
MIVNDLSVVHLYSDVNRDRARSTVLGTLTIIVLVGTFVLDLGLPIGVSVGALYSLAIVLALQWKGRPAIAAVTAIAMIFMLLDLWLGPGGDRETGITNRAIGIVTITGVALICLYIDWRRRRIGQALKTASVSGTRLRLFLNCLNDAGVVLTDIRGRVTEWSDGAQQLTGYPTDQTIGQPLFRRFPKQSTTAVRWSHICRQARLEGKAVREEAYRCQDGSWRWIHIVIRPLRNRLGRLRGYSLVMHDLTNRKRAEDVSDKSGNTISQQM